MKQRARDQEWLEKKLQYLIGTYFNDVPIPNGGLNIKYGKRAKRQLGCIEQKPDGTSEIRITKHYMDERVPEWVVESTIAHELTHYAHGFNSPLPQKFRHPHKHGVVRREMDNRDLHNLHKKEKKWLRENWKYIIDEA